jgi:hypothetical protein
VTAISTQPGAAQAAGQAPGSRLARLLRGRPDDPAWARPALLALMLATALLYLVGLSRNGWANEFYAGAAQAGTESWKAFLFGSLDSSNFITVDKPAGFLWPMELSARIFGVNYWSLLLPQALAGVATVGVLYATVRRWFGPAAAIIAGAVMALTPVATLIFRFNDPDAFITLMATLAAYAGVRALESGRTRWVALTGVLFGLGFLGKMLAGFLALPALALAYLICGPAGLGKRIALSKQRDGVNLDDPGEVQRWIDAFNRRPFDRLDVSTNASDTGSDRPVAMAGSRVVDALGDTGIRTATGSFKKDIIPECDDLTPGATMILHLQINTKRAQGLHDVGHALRADITTVVVDLLV